MWPDPRSLPRPPKVLWPECVRVRLPAMIPSICSRAAANMSLASDVIIFSVERICRGDGAKRRTMIHKRSLPKAVRYRITGRVYSSQLMMDVCSNTFLLLSVLRDSKLNIFDFVLIQACCMFLHSHLGKKEKKP